MAFMYTNKKIRANTTVIDRSHGNMKTPFKLKAKAKSDTYPERICAASRCDSPSSVIHAVTDPVPLCDRHWGIYCEAGK